MTVRSPPTMPPPDGGPWQWADPARARPPLPVRMALLPACTIRHGGLTTLTTRSGAMMGHVTTIAPLRCP